MLRVALLVLLCCSVIVLAAPRSSGPPNVIVFFADDMGYGDLSITGHPTIRTPNIDRLAVEGKRLSQFYVGAPICSPSRASLMTGRLPIRNGVYTADDWPADNVFRVFYPSSTGGLPPSEVTIASLLKTAGYQTGLIGKWHLGHMPGFRPTDHGFDYFYGLPYSQDEGCPPYPCHEWQNIWPGVPLMENNTIIQQPVDLDTLTPRYNARAFEFISHNQNKPFFLYMAYDEVHVDLFASAQFKNVSRRGLFGDAMEEMDNSIGLIMQRLKDLGLDDNTFVFFTSDNGPWINQEVKGGSGGLFRGGKGSTWEGGMREPAIARWPGRIAPMTLSMEVASTMDLFVTIAELAGAKLPTDRVYDGHSLSNILFNNGPGVSNQFFYWREHTLYAARVGPWKAHFFTRDGFTLDAPQKHDPPLLYNIEHDPSEAYPLDVSQYPDIMAQIKAAVAAHEATIVKGQPQLDPQDPYYVPCCGHTPPLNVPLSECTC